MKTNQKITRSNNNVNGSPGEVIYKGEKQHLPTSFQVIRYNQNSEECFQTKCFEETLQERNPDKITWIDVNGLSNTEAIKKLGTHFHLHPLILEDIVDTHQRPKLDEYEDYCFVTLKMLFTHKNTYITEHISLVIGSDYVLTFQESENDVFENLRQRIKSNRGQVRKAKTDYLMYALIDAIIDNYYIITDQVDTQIEELEGTIFLEEADRDIVQNIQVLKREVIQLRRVIYPLRDMTSRIEKSSHPLIAKRTYNYLRDLHDHSIQLWENVEIYREMIGGLMDLYMSTVNKKMNEVMKVLTIMASIFIPLTFIAGIYGMNFENMPELGLRYGYFYVLGFMLIIILFMIWYFRRKKWM